jgi:hypothetical protein
MSHDSHTLLDITHLLTVAEKTVCFMDESIECVKPTSRDGESK